MRYEIVNEFPNAILFEEDDLCVSIYMPTQGPTQQNKILFKNQLQKASKSLEQTFRQREIEEILAPLYELEQDYNFWNKTKDSIAILMNREHCIIYNLFRDIKELVVVSDSFHIKPLLRVYQSADKYYVLGINRKTFSLYYGDRYELRELHFSEEVPITIEEVLGDQYTDSHLGGASSRGKAGMATSTHGFGGKKDEIEKDTEKYLRHVDRFVLDNYSKPARAPLILASLSEYQGIFRQLSHNPHLLEEGISKDFESMSKEDIRKESWAIVEQQFLERTRQLVDNYETEKNRGSASDDVEDIAKKAIENRIGSVLIESDRIIPGTIHTETGEIQQGTLDEMGTRDILDKIAERVLASGGEVILLPKERMPTSTGAAAVYRY